MIAATGPVGVSQVFPKEPMDTLFKDRYFVSGNGIGGCIGIGSGISSGSGIAK